MSGTGAALRYGTTQPRPQCSSAPHPWKGVQQDIACSGHHSRFLHKSTASVCPAGWLAPRKAEAANPFSPKATVVLAHMENGSLLVYAAVELGSSLVGPM